MTSQVRAVTAGELGEYLGCLRTAFLTDREVTVEEIVNMTASKLSEARNPGKRFIGVLLFSLLRNQCR